MLTANLACFNAMKLVQHERAGPPVLEEERLCTGRRRAPQAVSNAGTPQSPDEHALGLFLQRFQDRSHISKCCLAPPPWVSFRPAGFMRCSASCGCARRQPQCRLALAAHTRQHGCSFPPAFEPAAAIAFRTPSSRRTCNGRRWKTWLQAGST